MNTSRGPVSFKDVAVDFTQEEWQQLDPDEKITYGDVMLENYSHLVSVGYDYHQAKRHHGVEMKEVEQGEEPWIMEGEFPCQYIPEAESCYVAQAALQLQTSSHPTTSTLQSVGITGMSHSTRPVCSGHTWSTSCSSTPSQ
ncbi:putative postmeiotic segregation increased 2-like protein 3 [Hylobates moloch]|uniref:putative postmeiotic segregation increased 2-like protein 3 n=1 Tax=Hylobates moloch TaxID=81572 RepID=UPI0026750ED7|nr:putative postmeiotic segregation increased 2-like protein 3 [Hylobates moloch]